MTSPARHRSRRATAAVAIAAIATASISLASLGLGLAEPDAGRRAGSSAVVERTLTYVAVGASDSVGVGARVPLTQSWPQVFYREALPRSTVFVNVAAEGATVASALTTQVGPAVELEPDVVTVWLAVNDIVRGTPVDVYERDLTDLLRRLRRGGRTEVFVGDLPPLGSVPALATGARALGLDLGAIVAERNAAIRRAADASGAVVVDLGAALERAGQLGGDPTALVAPDGFHPSTAGHRALADAFADAYRRTR